jgi:hypothetical protein
MWTRWSDNLFTTREFQQTMCQVGHITSYILTATSMSATSRTCCYAKRLIWGWCWTDENSSMRCARSSCNKKPITWNRQVRTCGPYVTTCHHVSTCFYMWQVVGNMLKTREFFVQACSDSLWYAKWHHCIEGGNGNGITVRDVGTKWLPPFYPAR